MNKKLSKKSHHQSIVVIGDTAIHNHSDSIFGAVYVAAHLKKFTSHIRLITAAGNDRTGELIKKFISTQKLSLNDIITTPSPSLVIDNSFHLSGKASQQPLSLEQQLINAINKHVPSADIIVIVDYGHLLSPLITSWLKAYIQQSHAIIAINNSHQPSWYKDIHPTVKSFTYQQAVELLSLPLETSPDKQIDQLKLRSSQLLTKCHAKAVSVLVENEGIWAYCRGKQEFQAFKSGTSLAKQHQQLSLLSGILSISLSGSKPLPLIIKPSLSMTEQLWQEDEPSQSLPVQKIISTREQLIQIVAQNKKSGKRVVLTNGCFDILHPGHIQYLQQAKAFGDILIVGINTDESIKKIKGPHRPINALVDRMQVLSGLQSVDYVISFPEDTAVELVKALKPQVYVKGGDYQLNTLPEAAWVQIYGGQVEIVPYISNKSTTQIIERIQSQKTKKSTALTLSYDTK